MRVEVAIDEAREYIGKGEFAQARAVLDPYHDHPKAQYWLRRIEKSTQSGQQRLSRDRLFTYRWDLVLAAVIFLVFAIIIMAIGLTA